MRYLCVRYLYVSCLYVRDCMHYLCLGKLFICGYGLLIVVQNGRYLYTTARICRNTWWVGAKEKFRQVLVLYYFFACNNKTFLFFFFSFHLYVACFKYKRQNQEIKIRLLDFQGGGGQGRYNSLNIFIPQRCRTIRIE